MAPVGCPVLLDTIGRAPHASPFEWLFFRELRAGTGRRRSLGRRGDLLAELKHPLKRRIGMRYSNEFYFVTPAGMAEAAEIPAGPAAHGGRTAIADESSAYYMIVVPAPRRNTLALRGN